MPDTIGKPKKEQEITSRNLFDAEKKHVCNLLVFGKDCNGLCLIGKCPATTNGESNCVSPPISKFK